MMHIKDKLKEACKLFDFKLSVQNTGSSEWKRIFIIDNRGCSIGRISMHKDEIYNIKSYKSSYIREIDETDKVFLRLHKYLYNNIIITDEKYNTLVRQAYSASDEDLSNKLYWRSNNPKLDKNGKKKYRKRIEGKNPRRFLNESILEIKE